MVCNIDLANSIFISMGTSFRIIECGSCHIVYGMPVEYFENRRKDHGSWRCPNTDCDSTWSYSGENTEEKLKRQLSAANEMARRFELEGKVSERAARAYKGQVTKIKKRIVNGVCPECNRCFKNVRRHMEAKHPSKN